MIVISLEMNINVEGEAMIVVTIIVDVTETMTNTSGADRSHNKGSERIGMGMEALERYSWTPLCKKMVQFILTGKSTLSMSVAGMDGINTMIAHVSGSVQKGTLNERMKEVRQKLARGSLKKKVEFIRASIPVPTLLLHMALPTKVPWTFLICC